MPALETAVDIGSNYVHTRMDRQLQPRSSLRIRSARMVLDLIGACRARNPHQAWLPFLRNLPNRHEVTLTISLNKNISVSKGGDVFYLEIKKKIWDDLFHGDVPERLNGPHSKCGIPSRVSEVRILPSPQIETSRFERVDARRKAGAARDNSRRRFAAKWLGGLNSKRADLSRIKGFVPIFLTNDLICQKSSEVVKKSACFVSKIHSRRGSTQCFLPFSKSFFLGLKPEKFRENWY